MSLLDLRSFTYKLRCNCLFFFTMDISLKGDGFVSWTRELTTYLTLNVTLVAEGSKSAPPSTDTILSM